MPGKGAIARKKALLADVAAWVNYAFSSGDHANPFAADDKRHAMFQAALARVLATDADFREMHAIHGGDPEQLCKRTYRKPTLVPIEALGQIGAQA